MHIRIVHRSRGSFAFQLARDDGSMALAGAPQRDVDACVLAIRELIASLRERDAVVHSVKAGQHRWTLRGERDRVLAESPPRPSLADAEALLAELQRWAADETQFHVRFPPEQRTGPTDLGADIGVAVRYDLGEPSCSGRSGLELLRRTRDDLHCAHFNDADGRPLLYTRGFSGAYLRDEQVRALLQALPQRRRYRRHDVDGRSYLVVTARNGGELARSRWFEQPGECDAAIDWLVRVAPGAAALDEPRPASASGSYLLDRPGTTGAPGFEAFRHSDRRHYFHVNGPDGAPLLYSHAYGSARELDAGMRTLIRVAILRDHYRRRLDHPPLHFVILAGNGRELARSRDFTDPAELDAAILWLLQELIGLGTLAGIRRRETVHFAVPHDEADPEPAPPIDTPASDPVHAWRTIADRLAPDPEPVPEPVPEPAPIAEPAPAHAAPMPRTSTIPRRVEALLAELRVDRSPHPTGLTPHAPFTHAPFTHPAATPDSSLTDDPPTIPAPAPEPLDEPILARVPLPIDEPILAPVPLRFESEILARPAPSDEILAPDPYLHRLPARLRDESTIRTLVPPLSFTPAPVADEPTIPAPVAAIPRDEPTIPTPIPPREEPTIPVAAEPAIAVHAPIPTPVAVKPTPEPPRPAAPAPQRPVTLKPTPDSLAPAAAPPRPAAAPAPVREAPKLNLPPPPSAHAPPSLPRRSDIPKTTPPRAPFVPSAPLYPRPATIQPQSPHPAAITTPVAAPLPDPARADPSPRPAIVPQRPIPAPVLHAADPRPPQSPQFESSPELTPRDPSRSHAAPESPHLDPPLTPRDHPRSHAIPESPPLDPPLTPRNHPRSHAIPDLLDPPLAPRNHPRSHAIPDSPEPRRFGETLPTALATPTIARRSGPIPSLLPATPTPTPAPAPRPANLLPTTPPTAAELPRPPAPIAAPRPRPRPNYTLLGLLAVLLVLVILILQSPWSASPANATATSDDPPPTPITANPRTDAPPPTLAPGVPLACPLAPDADPALGVLVAPFQPLADRPVRLLAATLADETPLVLQILGPDRRPLPDLAVTLDPGVPSAAVATATLPAGSYTLAVGRGVTGLRCHDFTVATTNLPAPAPQGASAWPSERAWTPAEEALHSAWLRALLDDPAPTLARLDLATRDPQKNLLHDALGLAEDSERGLELHPNHADLPYTLRAYWAWKRRLPFAYRSCAPGPANGAARCPPAKSNHSPDPDAPGSALARAQRFFQRSLPRAVQPANLRTALDDAASDFYPVALARHVLRPGTVYADPYGHVLLLIGQRPATPEHAGVLLAVAGHPDGSITREHFWPGSFLYDPDPALGGSGFRHFRPAVLRGADVVQLGDDAIAGSLEHGDLWTGYAALTADEFHDRVDTLVGTGTRDPFLAQRDLVDALALAVQARVAAIDQGAAHLRSQSRPLPMPPGFEIFAASGPWERLASPGRDLRLLTALTAVRRFVDRVRSNPAAYGTPDGERGDPIHTQLISDRDRLLADPRRQFNYRRSDGSQHTLTLADLVHRIPALEVAYNPNDCPEHRWGAPAGSDEASTCTRRAPRDQQQRMEAYRPWFRERPRAP